MPLKSLFAALALATASLSWVETKPLVRLSATPMIKPPSIAPGRMPMPPSTAAMKAFRPGIAPMVGETVG